jgi:hypothetical protein
MISDKDVAKQISDLMIDLSQKIDDSIRLVQEKCPENDFKAYRSAAARVLGSAFLDVMTPIYQLHPSLKPEGLR